MRFIARCNTIEHSAKDRVRSKRAVKKSTSRDPIGKSAVPKESTSAAGEEHLRRVRRFCVALPGTAEKISHGEPTFFVAKKVYVMFANNPHNDGRVAVGIPAPPGLQATLIKSEPKKFFTPPYVGVRGWVGIELGEIDDEELVFHISEAWRLVAPKKLRSF